MPSVGDSRSSPISIASLARDLAVSPTTLRRYLDILQALYVVIVVPPWHHNIACALLQAPKVYFNDTALVKGDLGLRLHTIRTKDGAEVDFCHSLDGELTTLVECKLLDTTPHRALVRDARQLEVRGAVTIAPAGEWLAGLAP